MRLLLLAGLFPTLAVCCVPFQNSSYRHVSHLARMNLSIFYDHNYGRQVEEISCQLKGVFAAVNMHPISFNTTKMSDICNNAQFVEKLRFLGLIQVTMTIGRLKSHEAEAECNITANLLHLKVAEKQWLAHLITRRSDFIMAIGRADNGSIPVGLAKAVQFMMTISGPVLTLPQTGVYKAQQAEQKRRKEVAGAWIRVLLGVGVSSLLAVVVAAAVVVGVVASKRRAQRKEEKSKQLAEKTNEGEEGQFMLEVSDGEEDQPAQ